MSFAIIQPVIDPKMRGLCVKPYPNHPKGCPNFNHKSGCPPKAPLISEAIDLTKPCYAIWNVFDFAGHVRRMKEKHPDWTERQLRCVLYWQPKARKALRGEIKAFLRDHRDLTVIACPEAQGVNLTATMKTIGIELEWPPEKVAYQIVLAGVKK